MIGKLYESEEKRQTISTATKQFMSNAYNINRRLDGLIKRIQQES